MKSFLRISTVNLVLLLQSRAFAPDPLRANHSPQTWTTDRVASDQPAYIVGKAILLLPHNAHNALSNFGRNSPFGRPTLLDAAMHLSRKAYFFSNATVFVDVAVVHPDGGILLLSPPSYTLELSHEHEHPNVNKDLAQTQLQQRSSSSSQPQQLEQKLIPQPESLLVSTDALFAISLQQETDVSFLQRIVQVRDNRLQGERLVTTCTFCMDCNITQSHDRVSTFSSQQTSFFSHILVTLPFTKQASAKRLLFKMNALFNRHTSDDFTVALMLFFNQYPTLHPLHHPGTTSSSTSSSSSSSTKRVHGQDTPHIDWVKHSIDVTWEKGPVRNAKEFYSMVTQCGGCIAQCMSDFQCRECISKLSKIDTRDQVESYRTIVSYDGSELLKEFSLCILQKNNVFQCDAKTPSIPKVEPLKIWRGLPLSHETAQNLLIGHLNAETALEGSMRGAVSWKVAAGANAAYDQFPSQNQLFYKSSGKAMWYDPIFRVKTIDGRDIWCKRHYRVRTAAIPGTFRFSVLDNGVTSDEFWTIVAADDDLKWIIFHYAGSASAVGLQYLGGLLCTVDGSLPEESDRTLIWEGLRTAGIEPWELFVVDNDTNSPEYIAAGPPPLDFYRKGAIKGEQQIANK